MKAWATFPIRDEAYKYLKKRVKELKEAEVVDISLIIKFEMEIRKYENYYK